MKLSKTRIMTESAILLAIATVLSIIVLLSLPYGGSVTLASMVPIMIISYRHGLKIGLLSSFVFAVIQQLLGLKTLSYVTTWQSILAVILLDYIIAYLVIGLAGIFRKTIKNQAMSLVFGGLFVCVLRYICHVISGATVWAGISIPTLGATIYSLSYNATYMIPETIVSLVVAYFLGSSLDFNREMPITLKKDKDRKINVFSIIAGLIAAAAVVVDAILIFANLQDPETGEFYIQGLSNANWPLIGIITGGALIVSAVLFIIGKKVCKKD